MPSFKRMAARVMVGRFLGECGLRALIDCDAAVSLYLTALFLL